MPSPIGGIGWNQRDAHNMGIVDKMAGDSGAKAAPVHPAAQVAAKAAPQPSSYAPRAVETNATHVYGSPIEGNAASK